MLKSVHRNKTVLSNVALGIAGIAIVSTMVVRSSSAAFTGQTANDGNSWGAGTVSLSDNDAESAMFSVANLRPTDSGGECIEVTYTGSLDPAEPVKLYAAVTDTDGVNGDTAVPSGQLSDDLDVTVSVYGKGETCATTAPTTTEVYSGVLGGIGDAYATASASPWTPNPETAGDDVVRAFSIDYTLGSDTANDAQGDGTAANFTWEATS